MRNESHQTKFAALCLSRTCWLLVVLLERDKLEENMHLMHSCSNKANPRYGQSRFHSCATNNNSNIAHVHHDCHHMYNNCKLHPSTFL